MHVRRPCPVVGGHTPKHGPPGRWPFRLIVVGLFIGGAAGALVAFTSEGTINCGSDNSCLLQHYYLTAAHKVILGIVVGYAAAAVLIHVVVFVRLHWPSGQGAHALPIRAALVNPHPHVPAGLPATVIAAPRHEAARHAPQTGPARPERDTREHDTVEWERETAEWERASDEHLLAAEEHRRDIDLWAIGAEMRQRAADERLRITEARQHAADEVLRGTVASIREAEAWLEDVAGRVRRAARRGPRSGRRALDCATDGRRLPLGGP